MPDKDRKRVPDFRSGILDGSLPQGHSAVPKNGRSEYRRLSKDSEKESRDESIQRCIINGGGSGQGICGNLYMSRTSDTKLEAFHIFTSK